MNLTYDQLSSGFIADAIRGKLIPVIYSRINFGWDLNSQNFSTRMPSGSTIFWIFLHCLTVKFSTRSLVGKFVRFSESGPIIDELTRCVFASMPEVPPSRNVIPHLLLTSSTGRAISAQAM